MTLRLALLSIIIASLALSLTAQTSNNGAASVSVPPVIQFSNVAADDNGEPFSGTVSMTFSLYNNSLGGQALWSETQTVQLGSGGQYSVYLGLTKANGLPMNLFTSNQAEWLGVKIAGQTEQPRIFFVSVPYAMKAGDAATIGGLPPTAFVMATPATSSANSTSAQTGASSSPPSAPPPNGAITGSGTVAYIPLWDTTSDIISSILYQSGSGATAAIGVNTTTPAATLDVNGGVISRGPLELPTTGTATSSQGYNSQPLQLQGSAYNGAGTIGPLFQLQTEPSSNNTADAAGTLSLLYSNGSGQPTETGFNIANSGLVTFVGTQTFPNTVQGITAGNSGITIGGTKANPTISINATFANQNYAQLKAANTFTANQTVNATMTATSFSGNGSGLTNVNAAEFGGLASSAFAQLGATSNVFTGSITASSFTGNGTGLTNVNAAELNGFTSNAFQPAGSYATLGANTFTGAQTISTGDLALSNGNLDMPATTSSSVGVLTMGGFSFMHSYGGPGNVFLGIGAGGGMATSSQGQNIGIGNSTLYSAPGSQNVAVGGSALNSVGSNANNNTAIGWAAGFVINLGQLNGSNDTFLGAGANTWMNQNISNSTAIGANAAVTQNNSLVLGSISGTNFATANTRVGIGTTAPGATLDVEAPSGSAPTVNFGSATNPATFTVNGSGTFTGNVTFPATQTFPGVAELNVANTFTGNQTVNGNIVLPSTNSGGTQGVISIGGTPFISNYGPLASYNAFFGYQAGNFTTTGSYLTGVGYVALYSNTSGSQNTATGPATLALNTTGSSNTANGYSALFSNTNGSFNTGLGQVALFSNTTGDFNAATGVGALYANTTGASNTADGNDALAANTTGIGNTAVGVFALTNPTKATIGNTTGSNNTAVGYSAGLTLDSSNITGLGNSFFGYNAALQNGLINDTAVTNATAIGANATVGESNALVLGSIKGTNGASASVQVGIGTTTPGFTLDVEAPSGSAPTVNFGSATNPAVFTVNGTSTFTGSVNFSSAPTFPNLNVESGTNPTLDVGTSSSAGTLDLYGVLQIGGNAFDYGSFANGNAFTGFAGNGKLPSSGVDNTAVGAGTLILAAPGNQNTAVGFEALRQTTASDNTAIGYQALFVNSAGNANTATGGGALGVNTIGSNNTASGAGALSANTTGTNNTASGFGALNLNTTGFYNTAMGSSAGRTLNGSNITGQYNSFFGYNTALPSGTINSSAVTNATAIGAFAEVGESNALVLGSVYDSNRATSNVNVGIGTTTPMATLDVEAPGGSPAAPTVNFGSATNPATFTVNGISTFNGGVSFSSSSTFPALNVESSNNPTLNVGSSNSAGTLSLYGDLLIGGTIFDYGSAQAGNAFVGFAGSSGLMPAGTANTAVGFLALTTNVGATSTGSANTAVGFESMLANSTGSYNTATGYAALLSNTGSYNTATGVYGLFENTTGGDNTAAGYQALNGNTAGSYNTASGYQALNTNTTGGGNSGFGAFAGSTQDQSQITGSYNSFFGYLAGLTSNLDGNGNVISNATALGAAATVGESNALVLGSNVNVGISTSVPAGPLHINGPYGAPASGQASGNNGLLLGTNGDTGYKWIQSYGGALALNPKGNSVGIGTNAPDMTLTVNGGADKPGGGSWGTFSDRRLKNLDGSFHSGLSQIMQINPVLYRYKEENAMGITDHQEHVGVVAQDVQKVIPEAVSENSRGYLLVNNDPVIWAMLNAIKEQQKLIQKQQAQIVQLTLQVKTIRTSLKNQGGNGSELHAAKAQASLAQ